MKPIHSKKEAKAVKTIAKNEAAKIGMEVANPKNDQNIVLKGTQTHRFGWVFLFTTKKYESSKNLKDLIPGISPVLVDKEGKIVVSLDFISPGKAIKEYEKKRKK